MSLCVKELTNTLLFVNERNTIVGTATITVGRYEIRKISVCILGTGANNTTTIEGNKISPRFMVKSLKKKEYNEIRMKREEENREIIRKKACEAYFKGVK